MDTIEEPIHIVIRLPYPRPEGYTDAQPVWTEAMDKTLWQLIGHTKPSLVDWHAVSRQLGNVPVPFLIQHAANLYQDQLQDLHRMGEQQDLTTPLQGSSRSTHRGIVGSGTAMSAALESGTITQQPALPFAVGAGAPRETPSSGSNTKAQASPSLSGSISTFPVSARPASMSSSASTIRPVQPSSPSPSPSLRNVVVESNVHGSGIVSNRGGPSQPRSTRGSQLERRLNNQMSALSMSPRDDIFAPEATRPIPEPAHPFHQATLSASVRLTSPTMSTQSARSSPGRSSEHGHNTTGGFQDQDRASTVSSSSTPFSQSNSTSQIFEETSFFNQLPIHESLSRGHQRTETGHYDGSVFQPSPFAQPQGIYGLGFLDQTPFFSRSSHRGGHGDDDEEEGEEDRDEEEDEDGVHAGKDRDGSSQDGSGPLREEIRHLHPEEELAFLPSGGMSASSVLTKGAGDGYQRRAVLGNNMPFQLDDELASLGTRGLEEILGHEGGEEEEDHRVRGIRFKEAVEPSRVRGQGEVLSSASRKSSAQNSVGSSFSDLSDSISRSALEEEYLAGYNNSNNNNSNNGSGSNSTQSKISLFMHASTRN